MNTHTAKTRKNKVDVTGYTENTPSNDIENRLNSMLTGYTESIGQRYTESIGQRYTERTPQ